MGTQKEFTITKYFIIISLYTNFKMNTAFLVTASRNLKTWIMKVDLKYFTKINPKCFKMDLIYMQNKPSHSKYFNNCIRTASNVNLHTFLKTFRITFLCRHAKNDVVYSYISWDVHEIVRPLFRFFLCIIGNTYLCHLHKNVTTWNIFCCTVT